MFELPLHVADEPAAPKEIAAAAPMRILVIDDDPILLRSLRAALAADGHTVTTAEGGQAGINTFRKAAEEGAPFALVITDLGMPYADGRRVASAIKDASPTTPLIMLTGWGQRITDDGDLPAYIGRILAKRPKLADARRALLELTSNRAATDN